MEWNALQPLWCFLRWARWLGGRRDTDEKLQVFWLHSNASISLQPSNLRKRSWSLVHRAAIDLLERRGKWRHYFYCFCHEFRRLTSTLLTNKAVSGGAVDTSETDGSIQTSRFYFAADFRERVKRTTTLVIFNLFLISFGISTLLFVHFSSPLK